MVEQSAVNRSVVGSSPTGGARKPLKTLRFRGFFSFLASLHFGFFYLLWGLTASIKNIQKNLTTFLDQKCSQIFLLVYMECHIVREYLT